MNNEEAWNALFERYQIVDIVQREGLFRISAPTIKEYREPRLMTKFDFRGQLPTSFAENNLSILPVTRGDYIISTIETFQSLEDIPNIAIEEKEIPGDIESLDFSTITSESMAINCAYATGILSDFCGEESLLPTAEGRMASDAFSFQIERTVPHALPLPVSVENTQIEIDGGFEGKTCFLLIEAKNRIYKDFMVRQLYYPYRKWTQKIKKPVLPIFFQYSNGIFHLRQFEVKDINNYNSLIVVKEKKYRLKESDCLITFDKLFALLHRVKTLPEPKGVPFPQADSFERIINLCELLYNKEEDVYTKEVLNYNMSFTGQSDFTRRQVDYYTNASIYLGLVKKVEDASPTAFVLTDLGLKILSTKKINERQLLFIETIISHQAFARVLRLYMEKGACPSIEEIVEIMKTCDLFNVGTEKMFHRRGQTIKAWVEWIIGTVEEEKSNIKPHEYGLFDIVRDAADPDFRHYKK